MPKIGELKDNWCVFCKKSIREEAPAWWKAKHIWRCENENSRYKGMYFLELKNSLVCRDFDGNVEEGRKSF